MSPKTEAEAHAEVSTALNRLQRSIVAAHEALSDCVRPEVRLVVLAGTRCGCERIMSAKMLRGDSKWCIVPTEFGILDRYLRAAGHPDVAEMLEQAEPSAIRTVLVGCDWISVVELHPTPDAQA